ncbi:phosphatidylglycerol lysyltransferase domain-containing protein [Paenibacillus sp.]|uniref:phosphatidylglycerol lysyltransferase domain-containing protein n=1 Tax=Paenibacillus sp. TaxID=58172 RepID=UPI0028115786|nr:phosphatidylglycerol lysyltransferase domain-containing protein [Paenibacillus sp.]
MNASISLSFPHPSERAGAAIGNSVSHLHYQEDKRRFWSADRSAYLLYASIAGKRVVLGDPVGSETDGRAALAEFLSSGKTSGRDCIFYQMGPRYAAWLERYGFHTMKTGEEASVALTGFHTNGKSWVKLRTKIHKIEREGYRSEISLPPHADALMSEIQSVSDAWLGGKREKSFSVGSYCDTYVAAHPVATLRSPGGELLAFVTLAAFQRPEGERGLAIDLMRYRDGSPSGGMETLFVRILTWGQASGYAECSLGASPMANASDSRPWLKLVRRVAARYYNFDGLQRFKAKFQPGWEDRYLAYSGGSAFVALALVALLVHRRRRNRSRSPEICGTSAARSTH